MRKKSLIQRLDFQVSILVSIMVILSGLILFLFTYTLSYKQMVSTLASRAACIAEYIDLSLERKHFTHIQTIEDMKRDTYLNTHEFLENVRNISSAQYLYTATVNKDGKLIYHIDGLPLDDENFRKPGDLIEPDFQDDLLKAMNGEIVMPNHILNTEWGDVFVAYYPVHDNQNQVVGAIGIEFTAKIQYEAFRNIRLLTPLVILLTCICAVIISFYLFRRISNPHFRDLANTDLLTGIKNRNAYAVDTSNLIQTKRIKNCALILADLNGLKIVNDHYGHAIGDSYIKNFSKSLQTNKSKDHVIYRIGGDEFAILFFSATEEYLKKYILDVKSLLDNHCKKSIPFCGVSMGYSFCYDNTEQAFEQAQAEADIELYKDKKLFYTDNTNFDPRINI